MNEMNYPISIRPLTKEEGGGYLAEVLDLPGCIADGETPQEAFTEVISAIDSWIKTAQEFGDPIPNPSTSERYNCRENFGDGLHGNPPFELSRIP